MAFFEYPSNFSNGTAVIGVGTMFQYANYVTGGFFSLGILVVIFIMTFMVGIMMSSRKALLGSSFITFIFSVYFLRLDMINPVVIFALIALMIAGAIGAKEESGGV